MIYIRKFGDDDPMNKTLNSAGKIDRKISLCPLCLILGCKCNARKVKRKLEFSKSLPRRGRDFSGGGGRDIELVEKLGRGNEASRVFNERGGFGRAAICLLSFDASWRDWS